MSGLWTTDGVSTLTTPGFVYFIQGVNGGWFEPVEELLACIERFRESPPEPPTLPPKPPKASPPVEAYRPPKRAKEPVDWSLTPEEVARAERLRDVVRALE